MQMRQYPKGFSRRYTARDHRMVFLKVDPRLDQLRDRRDFGRLRERMRY
jgi:hypothetical protein